MTGVIHAHIAHSTPAKLHGTNKKPLWIPYLCPQQGEESQAILFSCTILFIQLDQVMGSGSRVVEGWKVSDHF